MLRLEDFRRFVPDQTIAQIYSRARRLYGKHIFHLNATYQGGGVAEILYSLVLLMNDVGIDTGWRILHGSQEFFEVTKSFHNALQGKKIALTDRKKQIYLDINEMFSRFTHVDHDCVIIHDPQPLAFIRSYHKRQPWIWRCHIDLTDPDSELWDFLKTFVLKYDQMIVSSDKYLKPDLPVPQRVMFPAINPLNAKNRDMDEKEVRQEIERAGNREPLVNAIQRFSSVIIQKSLREGFCLCVTEAMWKEAAVVASNIGGIPVQIEDGHNGFLLEPTDTDGFAERIVHLLKNPDHARQLGKQAKETVRERFLITRLLNDYLDLLNTVVDH